MAQRHAFPVGSKCQYPRTIAKQNGRSRRLCQRGDGKRLPLTGEDLRVYLQNLPAEQIDRIEIITNPGAKYEAEGNAGIIDIRLKRDKNIGANGSVNATYSQGM